MRSVRIFQPSAFLLILLTTNHLVRANQVWFVARTPMKPSSHVSVVQSNLNGKTLWTTT